MNYSWRKHILSWTLIGGLFGGWPITAQTQQSASPLTPPLPALPTLEEGQAHLAAKRFAAAETAFLSLVAKDPKDVSALLGLAEAYSKQKKTALALKTWQQALDSDSRAVPAWRGIAEATAKSAPLEAAKAFWMVAQYSKDRSAALRAATLWGLKKNREAAEAWRWAKKLGPLHREELQQWYDMAVAAEDRQALREIAQDRMALEPEQWQHKLAYALSWQQENPQQAASQLQELLNQQPNEPELWLAGVTFALAQGDSPLAQSRLETLQKLAPKHVELSRLQGDIYRQQGQEKAAREAYSQRLQMGPHLASNLGMAQLSIASKSWPEAKKFAEAGVKQDGRSIQAVALLSRVLVAMGDFPGAIKLASSWGDVAEAKGDLAEIQFWLGQALLGAGESNKAKNLFRRLQEGGDLRGNEGLADVVAKGGDSKKAAELYNKELSKRSKDISYLLKTAVAFIHAGRGSESEQLLTTILQLQPGHREASAYLGRAKVEQGALTEAIALLEPALQQSPEDVESNVALGKAYYLQQQDSLAAIPLATAVRVAPKHSEANLYRGLVAYRMGEKELALTHLSLGLSQFEHPEGLVALADLHLSAKKHEQAEKLLLRALKVNPNLDSGLHLMAQVQYHLGRIDEAEKAIATYLFRHPDDDVLLRLGGMTALRRGDLTTSEQRFSAASTRGKLTWQDMVAYGDVLVRLKSFPLAGKQLAMAKSQGAVGARFEGLTAYVHYHSSSDTTHTASHGEENTPKEEDVYLLLIGAEKALAAKDNAAANKALQRALSLEPLHPITNGLLGDVAMQRNKPLEAVAAYKRSLASHSQQPAMSRALVRALLAAKRPSEAQRLVREATSDTWAPDVLDAIKGDIAYALGNHKQAKMHYEAALEKNPKNIDALTGQANNYLKLPHYDKAIAFLEQAKQLQGQDESVLLSLAELYAEAGERKKATEVRLEAEQLAATQREARRAQLPSDAVKTVAIARFHTSADKSNEAWIGVTVAEGLARHLANAATLRVVDRSTVEAQKAAMATLAAEEDSDALAQAKQLVKLVPSQYVLLGSAQVIGETVQLQARMVDLSTNKIVRAAKASGGLDKLNEWIGQLAIDLTSDIAGVTEEERLRMTRGQQETTTEALRLLGEAQLLTYQGDNRAAQARFREAAQLDEGNTVALQGLQEAQKKLGVSNTIAILDFVPVGDAPSWIGAGLPEHLASKLSQVDGIQVVERGQLDKVKQELAFHVENEDFLDAESLPQVGNALAAGCILVGSYQKAGNNIQLNARLVEISSQKTLLGDQVIGEETALLQLQEQLAKKIVFALIGAPSEEELAALKSKQTYAQYKQEMEAMAAALKQRREVLAETGELPPEQPAVVNASMPEETVEKDGGDKDSMDGERMGVDGRLAWTARGPMPSLIYTLHEFSSKYVQFGFNLAVGSNQFLGGRPVMFQGQTQLGSKVFVVEPGIKAVASFLHLWRFHLGVGASFHVGLEQSIDGDGVFWHARNKPVRPNMDTRLILNLRPFLHGSFQLFEPLALMANLGYAIQFLGESERNNGSGLYVDLGLRFVLPEGSDVDDATHFGYRIGLVMPSDQKTASQYLAPGDVGLLMQHLQWSDQSGDGPYDGGWLFGYGFAAPQMLKAPNSQANEYRLFELAYEGTWRFLYARRTWLSPIVRGKLGLGYQMGTSPDGAALSGLGNFLITAGASVGTELAPLPWLVFPLAIGYDFYWSDSDVNLSGFALNAGVSLVWE